MKQTYLQFYLVFPIANLQYLCGLSSTCVNQKVNLFYPNNELASFHDDKFDANKLGFYVRMGWIMTTNFGQQIVLYRGSTTHGYNALLTFNPRSGRVTNCLENKILWITMSQRPSGYRIPTGEKIRTLLGYPEISLKPTRNRQTYDAI